MTHATLAATTDQPEDDIDNPAFHALLTAYGQQVRDGSPDSGAAASRAILEHLTAIRAADKHALWCAEVNLDGANEHLAEVQRELLTTRRNTLEEAARTVEAHSLAEKLARMTMANPVSHALNLVGVIAQAVRALNVTLAPDSTSIQAPLVNSPVARAIETDAVAFEAALGYKPERMRASTYSWGWCYVADTTQTAFKAWCNGDKSQVTGAAAQRNQQEKHNG
jgi:hypothetical protein